jgi:hypothetical protein
VIAVTTLLPEECSVADLPTTTATPSRAFFIVFVYERFKTNCIVRRGSKAAKCETTVIGMYYNKQQVARRSVATGHHSRCHDPVEYISSPPFLLRLDGF